MKWVHILELTSQTVTPLLEWLSLEQVGTYFVLLVVPMVSLRRQFRALVLLISCTNAVVWTKNNPTPWNTVKPDETTKLMTVNQKFAKKCVRLLSICETLVLN